MRCSKAMTSSNAARYTEPVGGGDPRTRGDPPDRPRDANSSPGTRARFRRFNYDVSIDIRYSVSRGLPLPTSHMRRDNPTLDEILRA